MRIPVSHHRLMISTVKSTAGLTLTYSANFSALGTALNSAEMYGCSNDGERASTSRSCRFISIRNEPSRRRSSGWISSLLAGRPGSKRYSSFSASTGSVSMTASSAFTPPSSQYFTSPCPSAVRRKNRVSCVRSGAALNASFNVTSRCADTSTWPIWRNRSTRSMGFGAGGIAAVSAVGAGLGGARVRVHFQTP